MSTISAASVSVAGLAMTRTERVFGAGMLIEGVGL